MHLNFNQLDGFNALIPIIFEKISYFLLTYELDILWWQNNLTMLKICVRRVHFAKIHFQKYILEKYTLEKYNMEIWKLLVIAFRKYIMPRSPRVLFNGPETATQWKSENITFWRTDGQANLLNGEGARDPYASTNILQSDIYSTKYFESTLKILVNLPHLYWLQ